MRALVTGASGFIGQHLVGFLAKRGHAVRCLVRASSRLEGLEPHDPELVLGDVTDPESLRNAVRGVDVVYHLAGTLKAFTLHDFLAVNEEGTRALAEACADRGQPPVCVLVSSAAASGPSPDGRARSEADPPAPVSDYGRSKLAGERAAAAFAARVPTSVVRPPIVFGPGDREFFKVFQLVARGLHLVPTRARRSFSLVHVADLVRHLVQTAETGRRLAPENGGGEAQERPRH